MQAVSTLSRQPGAIRIEWPTVGVAVTIYAGLALLTWHHALLPVWSLPLLGGYLVCWHGSLQHEVVHGHPTPWQRLNQALVALPVGLWMPFERYRETHLAHHRTDELTEPARDPESFYCTAEQWQRLPGWRRAVLHANNTLIGRLTVGPLLVVAALARAELPRLRERPTALLWLRHGAGVAAVLWWVTVICAMPAWLYLLAFAFPGLSLTLLRSYHEHQPAAAPAHRTNSVRGPLPVRLLFLNNNYHVAHHAAPHVPWFELPRLHGDRRWDASYARLLSRCWRRKDSPVHPCC